MKPSPVKKLTMQTSTSEVRKAVPKTVKLKICILGTRGIPNKYGGFEQFAEKFAIRMADKGHDVYVYNSHRHPYTGEQYNKVNLIRCFDPEHRLGSAGQFVYDLNCILDSRRRGFDIILQLGYTSSTVWSWLLPRDAVVVTNMDGLEWQRAKYSRLTQWFLSYAEKWGARYSDYLIADSKGIKDYLWERYQVSATYIPYGAEVYTPSDLTAPILPEFGLEPDGYDLLIARFEKENNIELALKAYAQLPEKQLVLIGDHQATRFGQYCFQQFRGFPNIRFLGAVYEDPVLHELRYFSRLYIHGHSVGGTNPSLLEAMACGAAVVAHDNIFNRAVLTENAFYFSDVDQLKAICNCYSLQEEHRQWKSENLQKIRDYYNWDHITEKIETAFCTWRKSGK